MPLYLFNDGFSTRVYRSLPEPIRPAGYSRFDILAAPHEPARFGRQVLSFCLHRRQ